MPTWLGPWEIIIVVVIIILIFGGRLIPRVGRSLGRSIVGLKKGLKEGEQGFKSAIKDDSETNVEQVKIPDKAGEGSDKPAAHAEGPEKT